MEPSTTPECDRIAEMQLSTPPRRRRPRVHRSHATVSEDKPCPPPSAVNQEKNDKGPPTAPFTTALQGNEDEGIAILSNGALLPVDRPDRHPGTAPLLPQQRSHRAGIATPGRCEISESTFGKWDWESFEEDLSMRSNSKRPRSPSISGIETPSSSNLHRRSTRRTPMENIRASAVCLQPRLALVSWITHGSQEVDQPRAL